MIMVIYAVAFLVLSQLAMSYTVWCEHCHQGAPEVQRLSSNDYVMIGSSILDDRQDFHLPSESCWHLMVCPVNIITTVAQGRQLDYACCLAFVHLMHVKFKVMAIRSKSYPGHPACTH